MALFRCSRHFFVRGIPMSTLPFARLRPAVFLLLLVPMLALPSGHVHAQLGSLSVNVITAPVNTLSIADVNWETASTPKWLFTVTISTGRTGPVGVIMELTLDALLASGENYPNAVTLITNTFTVNSVLTFTNMDLGKGVINDSIYVFDESAKRRFKDVALPTGALPAGKYRFTVKVREAPTSPPVIYIFTITLSNPSGVTLIFPMDGDASVNQFPLFRWQYDGSSARISIFEKLPGQSTLEEAAEGVPIHAEEVGKNNPKFQDPTSFQYPSYAVRSLQTGKTYIWYVEGLSGATGGTTIPIRSELRSFTVSSAGGASFMTYLDDLERALDPKYKPVFDQIRADGLIATGMLRLNGNPISTVELLKIIQQLRANPDGVLSVGLEQ
jgi:hypothetical protein